MPFIRQIVIVVVVLSLITGGVGLALWAENDAGKKGPGWQTDNNTIPYDQDDGQNDDQEYPYEGDDHGDDEIPDGPEPDEPPPIPEDPGDVYHFTPIHIAFHGKQFVIWPTTYHQLVPGLVMDPELRIIVGRSLEGGNWSDPFLISSSDQTNNSDWPTAVVHGGKLYVFWVTTPATEGSELEQWRDEGDITYRTLSGPDWGPISYAGIRTSFSFSTSVSYSGSIHLFARINPIDNSGFMGVLHWIFDDDPPEGGITPSSYFEAPFYEKFATVVFEQRLYLFWGNWSSLNYGVYEKGEWTLGRVYSRSEKEENPDPEPGSNTTEALMHCEEPALLVHDDTLYVAWLMYSPSPRIAVKQLNGGEWSGLIREVIHNGSDSCRYPMLFLLEGQLKLAYVYWNDTQSMSYLVQIDALNASVANITLASGNFITPMISFDSGIRPYLFWINDGDLYGGARSIEYSYYDHGAWSEIQAISLRYM